jgi:hypothetical protein
MEIAAKAAARRKPLQLKTLTYTSRASLDLSAADLAAIQDTARHLNALDGITGLLVFDGVRFLQIVEGSEEAIDSLVDRLRDERTVEERSFPDWSMELVRVSAGYLSARGEVETMLPAHVTAPVRQLVLTMSGDMAMLQMPD